MKLSIRTKLLAALGVDLILMLVLGSFALHQMSIMNQKADFVVNQTILSIDLVNAMNDVLLNYRTRQMEYILNAAPADKQRIEKELLDLETRMDGIFRNYSANYQPDATERLIFEQTQQDWQRYVFLTHTQFLPANRNSNTGNVHPSFGRLSPLYGSLQTNMQKIRAQSQARAEAARASVETAYSTSRFVIVSETILTVFVSAVIGLTLSGNIARRIRTLRDATIAVSGGDLSRQVSLRGGDELVLLANNFNLMVASLRQQRMLLEERNAELSASLETQQRLMEDLVQRKQAEEAAHRAQAAAEAASHAKSMFLATMSHELRTPLNAILGYVQLLHLEAQIHGRSEMLPDLERIRSAGKHLLTIISNILDFSKIEQGRMNVEIDTFNVSVIAHDMISIIEPLARNRNNTLILTCPPDIGMMQSDAGKVRQILFNLLSNAVKFTDNGTVALTIERECCSDGDWMRFSVADTGIGMSPEQLTRLFQPFTQVHQSHSSHAHRGTGLGLALSQQLCRLLGGDISVTSEVGRGSVFTVRLPAVISTAHTADVRLDFAQHIRSATRHDVDHATTAPSPYTTTTLSA
ncbi:ATP-binding protein [Roseiflexus sp.]|uniref:sensor histidine kinase n=1 Tax=Roseiflexus sp. TaxID=2562120 RepID=UPI0021DBDCEF|nr:ATP-binding protein [Roseiflexus sp.]GIV98703.1 MAG: histidine kinase [Roseiflexus sp.]